LPEVDIFLSRSEKITSQSEGMPGTLFGYDVLARLGEGAASTVYAVSDPKTGQVYALKHVIRHTNKDDRFIAQLNNEYQVITLFRHPLLRRSIDLKMNRTLLRKVIDAGLVMELVDGVPLDQEVPEEVGKVVDVFIQTAKALGALHYLRYVHCDLKPHNIMVLQDGTIKVVDFGQAARVGTAKERVQGTPDFMAPEQMKLKPISERTDVYSLGASLYWALTGQRVPTLFTVKKSERSILVNQDFPTPRALNGNVPEALSRLVMECVRVQPVGRPADMAQVATRLGETASSLR
jgi:serine/threonine-protein kinase